MPEHLLVRRTVARQRLGWIDLESLPLKTIEVALDRLATGQVFDPVVADHGQGRHEWSAGQGHAGPAGADHPPHPTREAHGGGP